MKYRVDWFCDGQHNKTHFPTYEDAYAYAEGIALCTGVKSVFILEMTARYGVYDVMKQIKQEGANNGKVIYQVNRCGDWFCTICCGTLDAA